ILDETGLPQRLWAEIAVTVAYLKNRFPHSHLDFEVPYVRWKKRGLSLRHIRRLGSKCFVHHTTPGRGKLEERAWMGVLVGYAIGTRGYRVWDPATDRVIETKHVKIDESVIYRNFGRHRDTDQHLDPIGNASSAWPKHISDSSDDDSSDTEYSPSSDSTGSSVSSKDAFEDMDFPDE
uniref:Retroviral polymerase SH3-like domain-containing protein n=1 Tax=Strigamia maritima TaxID=126957 RepID=T1IL47_STRMM